MSQAADTVPDSVSNEVKTESKPVYPPLTEEDKPAIPNNCNAGGNGWCKNTTKEGQKVCEECTKMMDSYP
uniref:Uncharacterized protein n=1 Tax=viral metagenome TaxID=1070528 RepID=A0A6C0KN88_9ZZZZ